MRWEYAALTDRGLRRAQNEDSHLLRPDLGLFAVADGMGGHAAGEVASRIAVDVLARHVEESHSRGDGRGRAGKLLQLAIAAANREIITASRRDPAHAGMGTTLTAVTLLPNADAAVVAHVGDSRAYRLRGLELQQLTRDHTWVQEQVDAGSLSPAQARRHPLSSMLTRALGTDASISVDVLESDLTEGDLLLLCSDGLTSMVEEPDLLEILRGTEHLEHVAARLVEAANMRGGHDNVTVVVVRVLT